MTLFDVSITDVKHVVVSRTHDYQNSSLRHGGGGFGWMLQRKAEHQKSDMIMIHTIRCFHPSEDLTPSAHPAHPAADPSAMAMRQCMHTRMLIPPLLLRRPMLSGRASR